MYGAILGDIIGSRFEFDRGGWTKDFELFTASDNWTDDTVMTIAVAKALMDAGKDAPADKIEAACTKEMQEWGRKYPDAGYGGRFIGWLRASEPKPYGSFGNGSAMRVSAAGWLYDSLERTREAARATANVSHNHPEGIKGAECSAAVIYMARTGASKDEIMEYVIKEFGYDLSETLEEMRQRHEHNETCQDSLPKALRSFFDGESFEDVVRNAVSLGGDTDTLAAIAGAMGEAFFGIPLALIAECLTRIEDDMREVLERFDEFSGRCSKREEGNAYGDNKELNEVFTAFVDETDEDMRVRYFTDFFNLLSQRVSEGAMVPTPFEDVNNVFARTFDLNSIKPGDSVEAKEDIRLRIDKMKDGYGDLWIPLFLSEEELHKGDTANIIMPVYIYNLLNIGLNDESVKGVIINPFGKFYPLGKEILKQFIVRYEEWAGENGIETPGSQEKED